MTRPWNTPLERAALEDAGRRRPAWIGLTPLLFKRILLLTLAHVSLAVSAFANCAAPQNPIEAENCLPGTPTSVWYLENAGSPNIRGFTTDISVNAGQTVFFKVTTNALAYRIDIYRLGKRERRRAEWAVRLRRQQCFPHENQFRKLLGGRGVQHESALS